MVGMRVGGGGDGGEVGGAAFWGLGVEGREGGGG